MLSAEWQPFCSIWNVLMICHWSAWLCESYWVAAGIHYSRCHLLTSCMTSRKTATCESWNIVQHIEAQEKWLASHRQHFEMMLLVLISIVAADDLVLYYRWNFRTLTLTLTLTFLVTSGHQHPQFLLKACSCPILWEKDIVMNTFRVKKSNFVDISGLSFWYQVMCIETLNWVIISSGDGWSPIHFEDII